MANSLIITFNELIDDLGVDTYSVIVNGQTRASDSLDVEGIYSTYIETYDVVSISIETSPSGLLRVVDIIRRDYTTDDQGGDNGIRDTFISSSSGTTGTTFITTFTATTIQSCYNYEYRITITTNVNPACEIEGSAVGTVVIPPIITSDLIIYANGYSYTGSTGGLKRYWLDNRGTVNGEISNGGVAKLYNTGFIELNGSSVLFTGYNNLQYFKPPISGTSYTFGGWVQTIQTDTSVDLFSVGNLKIYKNSSNYLAAQADTYWSGIVYATSPTLLDPNSNIWNYLICKWTPGDSLKFYINGSLVTTTVLSPYAIVLKNIGEWTVGPAVGTNVSDFEVYYVALTDDQILFNFNQLKFFYGY